MLEYKIFNSSSALMSSELSLNIFCSSRDGRVSSLFALLAEQSRPEQQQLLEQPVVCPDTGDRATPLVVAAKNGHKKVLVLDCF